jgi:hypothetical protein
MKGSSRMSNHEANEQGGAKQVNPRRPYVKPAFSSEPVLEIKALSCGKLVSTGLCSTHGGQSAS